MSSEKTIYSAPCKEDGMVRAVTCWAKKNTSIYCSTGLNSSLQVCIHCQTELLSIELHFPCWHYLQTRLGRKRNLLAKKERMEMPDTFTTVGFSLPSAGAGSISHTAF